jgi:hypothetical protein
MSNPEILPKWNDPAVQAGTMVRTALWLISEVGVGQSFTKQKHRRDFAGIAQADRRLRDLRKYGWVIHTSAEDATLNQNEQRLVAVGARVWDARERQSVAKTSIPAKSRRGALEKHNYQCSVCGIMGGESYLEPPIETAVLGVSSRTVVMADGTSDRMLVAECKRCKAGGGSHAIDPQHLVREIAALSPSERSLFMHWIRSKRRNRLDRLWAQFHRLPAEARDQITNTLLQQDKE